MLSAPNRSVKRAPVLEEETSTAIFTRTQTINIPVEQVFGTVIDVANSPKWNPTVRSARKLSEGPIGTISLASLLGGDQELSATPGEEREVFFRHAGLARESLEYGPPDAHIRESGIARQPL